MCNEVRGIDDLDRFPAKDALGLVRLEIYFVVLGAVPLPNFLLNWPTLMAEDLLFPGHSTVSSFLRPSSTRSTGTSPAALANFVSASGLQLPCPSSLKFVT